MNFNDHIMRKANAAIVRMQNDKSLPTVDHAESVAIVVWWTMLLQHSMHEDIPVEELARTQLEAFIETMAPKMWLQGHRGQH